MFIVKFLALFVKVTSKTGKSQKYMIYIVDLAYLQSSLRENLNEVNWHKDFQRFF